MANYRKDKLEEIIKRIIAETIQKEIRDPRIGFATVFRVKLASDLTMADVFISVLGDDKVKRETMSGLISAKGYIRGVLGKNLSIRTVPDIRFLLDESIEKGVDMINLIESVNEKDTPDSEE